MTDDVRRPWVAAVVRELQTTIGRLAGAPQSDATTTLCAMAPSLEVPVNAFEHVALYGMLVRFAVQAGMLLHPRVSLDCDKVQDRLIARLCAAAPDAILGAFGSWAAAFSDHLLAVHRPSAAAQVADRIQQHYRHTISLVGLARAHGVSPNLLRQEFVRTYGMTVREYTERVRITHAIDGLMDAKVEAVAREVGYRSAKNFYRALLKHTALTPTACRTLTPQARADVKVIIWLRSTPADRLQRLQVGEQIANR